MRTDVLTGPAAWAVDRLGFATAAQLWAKLPTALADVVRCTGTARPGFRLVADRPVAADAGWSASHEVFVAHLGGVEGAGPARTAACPAGVQVRDHLIVPWCYGPTGAISMRHASPDGALAELVGQLGRRSGPPPPGPARPGLLIAGYACTMQYGLLRACLGEAMFGPDGRLDWRHVEDLPLPPPTIPRPRRQHFP